MADLFGKEAAILCSSGVQANLIVMMVLAQKKGESIIMGDESHLMHYERGGMATIGSIMPRALRNNPDGTIDLKDIELNIPTIEDPHIVPPQAIALETSMNNCAGRALRPEYISKVKKLAKKYKLKMHCDGARSWNAAVFLGME